MSLFQNTLQISKTERVRSANHKMQDIKPSMLYFKFSTKVAEVKQAT